MRFLFKLIVLAALAYAGWWVWGNYDLPGWYQHVKSAAIRRDTRSVFVLPKKRGELFVQPNTITVKKGCEFSPDNFEIKIGEKIVWQNVSDEEQIIMVDNFRVLIIPSGRNAIKTFNESGRYAFNCMENERTKGWIIVK